MHCQSSLKLVVAGGMRLRAHRLAWQAMRLFAALTILFAIQQSPAQGGTTEFDELVKQANAARDEQNIPLAAQLYSQAVELNPNWAEGWWNLGLIDYTVKDYAQAIEAFNHLLNIDPHAVPAMAIRGLSEFDIADYDSSLKDLELAMQHGAANDKDHEQILRFHLGMLLTRAGRYWDALAQYRSLAGEHFDSPDFDAALGLVGMRKASLPSELDGEDKEMAEALGKAANAFLLDDSDESNRLFANVFARYPQTPNLHYFYGFLLFPHDRAMAVSQFQKEVAIDPSNPVTEGLLAFTLMYEGQYKDAIPAAESALATEHGMQLAELALGRSLIETGDDEHGVAILNQVLVQDPKNLEAHMGLAAAYSIEGRKEDAYRERMVCLGLGR